MKRNNYNDKINKINTDRNNINSLINNNILNDNTILTQSINDIELSIMFDDKNTKEYKYIISSKEKINTLIQKITNAKTFEEANKIRNSINYYINKIKRNIKNINIQDDVLENFNKSISILRKDESKKTRFLKRLNKLNEINILNNSYSTLDKENIKTLRRYLKNENDYNRRFIKNNSKKEKIKEDKEPIYDKYDPYQELKEDIITNEEKVEKNNPLNIETKKEIILNNNIEELSENINYYSNIYHIKKIVKYDKNKIHKIITLFRNLPIYSWNKKVIKQMNKDYKSFLINEDLLAFIEYNKRRNSALIAIKNIFDKSNIILEESEYLNNDMCKEWIENFYYKK